jgi:seryl-tRNA synthetase
MEWLFYAMMLGGITFGVAKALTATARDYVHNQRLRKYLDERNVAFKQGLLSGRHWLAEFIAEAEHTLDRRDDVLRNKKHPAKKSAEVVAEIKQEKRELAARLKFVEYQIKSYEEYFPLLADYRETILDETVPLSADAENAEELDAADPTTKYLSSQEWSTLPASQRNQLALDRYLKRPKANWEIGRVKETCDGRRKYCPTGIDLNATCLAGTGRGLLQRSALR